MKRINLIHHLTPPIVALAIISMAHAGLSPTSTAADSTLDALLRDFHEYSGARLVFRRDDLPEGRYHDVLKPLDESRQAEAAAICLEEARIYPPGFLGGVGLDCVGVFAACASKRTTDRSRPYDRQLGGYRYFGVYNGSNAVAAAFYTEGQLQLTFHHEIFHHVDSTVDGVTASWQLSSDDAFYQAAICGDRPYLPAYIAVDDLQALRQRCIGLTLKESVSNYAAKNPREDQAETARHLMSTLPDSLVQVTVDPNLPGSQRILHILREYRRAVPDGPDLDWFVDVALQRARRNVNPESIAQLISTFKKYAPDAQGGYGAVAKDPQGARAALSAAVRIGPATASQQQATEIVQLAANITSALLRQRIRPDDELRRFDVWGREDADGVNLTLRRDVERFGKDAKRLKLITSIHRKVVSAADDSLQREQLMNLHLLARYYVFIDSNWSVTPGTKKVFDSTRATMVESLPSGNDALARRLGAMSLVELAQSIPKVNKL